MQGRVFSKNIFQYIDFVSSVGIQYRHLRVVVALDRGPANGLISKTIIGGPSVTSSYENPFPIIQPSGSPLQVMNFEVN